jgi:hypothetical protein
MQMLETIHCESDSLKNSNEFFAHVFYLDFVSLSDPSLGDTESQIKKIEILFNMITKSKFFKNVDKPPIVSHTGDGAAICYLKNPRLPLELAIDLHKKIKSHNNKTKKKQHLQVRIGINSGLIFTTEGIGQKPNYWGRGINNAQRIMSFGTSNHILLDVTTATELISLSEKYRKYIHYLGIVKIKHGEKIPIYSAYDRDFGNKDKPESLKSQISSDSENTGSLILEGFRLSDMTKGQLVKILEQKSTRLKLSRTWAKKSQTRKTKKRRGQLR